MDNIFKPKYTMGYWAWLFFPVAPYFVMTFFYLNQMSTTREISAWFNLPYDGFGPANQLLVLLFGILVLLRIISDIVNGHIRKIEINSEGVVFRRLLGKSLTAVYQELQPNDSNFKISENFTVSLRNIENRDAMRALLQEQLKLYKTITEEKRKKYSAVWLDYLKAVLYLLGCALIILSFFPLDSYITLTDTAVWYIDGVIAILLFIYACFILRKALRSQ